MKQKRYTSFRAPVILLVMTILYTVLVRMTDVAAIGPEGTRVGWSHLNRWFFDLCGVHMIWYQITKWLGNLTLLIAALFALCGVMQLIQRKKIRKVDKRLRMLGVIYLITIAVYLFFEIVVINYRPVLMEGEIFPEASFPSSHTMLACTVLGTAPEAAKKMLRGKRMWRDILRYACIILAALITLGRLISGVHWMTDIIGGFFYSMTLITLYHALIRKRGR